MLPLPQVAQPGPVTLDTNCTSSVLDVGGITMAIRDSPHAIQTISHIDTLLVCRKVTGSPGLFRRSQGCITDAALISDPGHIIWITGIFVMVFKLGIVRIEDCREIPIRVMAIGPNAPSAICDCVNLVLTREAKLEIFACCRAHVRDAATAVILDRDRWVVRRFDGDESRESYSQSWRRFLSRR